MMNRLRITVQYLNQEDSKFEMDIPVITTYGIKPPKPEDLLKHSLQCEQILHRKHPSDVPRPSPYEQ